MAHFNLKDVVFVQKGVKIIERECFGGEMLVRLVCLRRTRVFPSSDVFLSLSPRAQLSVEPQV